MKIKIMIKTKMKVIMKNNKQKKKVLVAFLKKDLETLENQKLEAY